MPFCVGDKLGHYEVLSLLGQGGMGEVYRAKDTKLDRDVAIKVLPQALARDPERLARFEREAKVLASLDHPNIGHIHGIVDSEDSRGLVLALIEGPTLDERIAANAFPVAEAIAIAQQIIAALEYAHDRGVIHRDLKPANVKITPEGVVKVLDFGLAKVLEDEPPPSSLTDSPTLAAGHTRAGMILGTAAYMSPEQAVGRPADRRSDIFSFGAVLYEMLTGRPAFAGATTPDVLEAVVKNEPDWTRLPARTPAPIRTLLRRCLTKDRKQRLQAIGEARIVLESPRGTEEFPPSVSRPSRLPWIVGAAVVIGALLFVAIWRGPAPVMGEVVSFQIYPPEKTAFSNPLNITLNVPQFALSPDGRTIVFVAGAEGERPVLWRRPIGEVAAQALPGTEDAQDPFWSPDSRWIGYFAEGKLKKVPAAGGASPVQTVVPAGFDVRGGTWGPDDTILFANGTEPMQRVAATGGQPTPATTFAQGEASHRYPQFLPDGRHFLYVIPGSNEQTGVYAGSLDDRGKKLLARVKNSVIYGVPGYLLSVDGDTLFGQGFDADRLQTIGQPFLVAEHAGRTSAFKSAVSASRTGAIAYAGTLSPNGRLTWFDRGGRALDSIEPSGYYTDFRLSPNEKSLAASLLDSKTGFIDVWMTDLARGSRSRFTRGGTTLNASPIWSPDGTQLVFRNNRGRSNEFYQRSAAGGGNEQLLLSTQMVRAARMQSNNLVNTDWSPDGQSILFSVPGTASGMDLWLLPLTGQKNPVKYLASPADEMHGNFSPDGRLVAYTSNESGKFQVYVQTLLLSDKQWQVSTNGGYEPRWRADGREIYYLSEDRKLMAVPVGSGPTFAVPRALFQTRVPAGVTPNRTHYVPTRDGQRFLVNTQSGDVSPSPITVVMNWAAGLRK